MTRHLDRTCLFLTMNFWWPVEPRICRGWRKLMCIICKWFLRQSMTIEINWYIVQRPTHRQRHSEFRWHALQLNYSRTYTRKTYVRRYLNWHRDTLHECTKVFLHRNRNVYLNFVRFIVPTRYVRAKLIRKQYFPVIVAELQIASDHSCSPSGM